MYIYSYNWYDRDLLNPGLSFINFLSFEIHVAFCLLDHNI